MLGFFYTFHYIHKKAEMQDSLPKQWLLLFMVLQFSRYPFNMIYFLNASYTLECNSKNSLTIAHVRMPNLFSDFNFVDYEEANVSSQERPVIHQ